jgi:hypothetical protein
MPSKLRIGAALACAAFLLPAAGAFGADEKMPSQVTKAEVVHVVAEVTAIDLATRELTLAGPLGGRDRPPGRARGQEPSAGEGGRSRRITYYESMAISARKKGESNPLFVGGDSSTSAAGEKPAVQSSQQKHAVVKVFSVDVEKRLLVVENAAGKLISHEVERPEFVQKLAGLRPVTSSTWSTTAGVAISVTPGEGGFGAVGRARRRYADRRSRRGDAAGRQHADDQERARTHGQGHRRRKFKFTSAVSRRRSTTCSPECASSVRRSG